MLKPGLYEQVINKDLSDKIDDSAQLIDKRNIDKAEAPQVLAGYLFEVIEKGLSRLSGDDIEGQLGLANKIVSAVTELTGDEEFYGLSVDQRAEQLLAVANMQNNADAMKRRITMARPETSLASSSLFKSNAMVFLLISFLMHSILYLPRAINTKKDKMKK